MTPRPGLDSNPQAQATEGLSPPGNELSLLSAQAGTTAAMQAADSVRATQTEDRNTTPWHLAGLAYHALVFSAFQQPLDALAQLGNHAAHAAGIGDGKTFSAPHLSDAPAPVAFGSMGWVAETIGSGAGMVLPYLAADSIVGKTGSLLKDTRMAGLAESLPLSGRLAPIARPLASGMLFGAVLTPSDDNNFVAGRLKNAAVSGLTFGSQRAFSLGITRGLSAAGLPVGDAAFNASLKGTAARLLSNAAGGTLAGLVSANSDALLTHGRFASGQEDLQSAAAFTVTGGALDLAHIGSAKAGELGGRLRDYFGSDNGELLADTTDAGTVRDTAGAGTVRDTAGAGTTHDTTFAGTPDAQAAGDDIGDHTGGGGSGAMSKVQERMTAGSEAEREAAGEQAHAPGVIEARETLLETLRTRYGIDDNSAAGKQLKALIETAGQREFRTAEMNPQQIARLYGAVDKLLRSDKLTVPLNQQQRLQLAAQMLHEAGAVPTAVTPDPKTNSLLAIMQTLQYKFPGTTADAITSLVTDGAVKLGGRNPAVIDLSQSQLAKLPPEYRQTLQPSPQAAVSLSRALESASSTGGASPRMSYVQELLHVLGMNTMTQDPISGEGKAIFAVNRVNGQQCVFPIDGQQRALIPDIDTPQLQHVFERLSGTEKGSYVLKNGAPFVLIEPDGTYKLFADDTNYFNWAWRLNGQPLDLVDADMQGGFQGSMESTNRASDGLKEHSIYVTQETVVHDGSVHQRVRITNGGSKPQVLFAQRVAHDFVDMFEVRGWKRDAHGQQLPTEYDADSGSIRYGYQGLDGHVMTLDVHLSGAKPSAVEERAITWRLSLAPGESTTLDVQVKPGLDAAKPDWNKEPSFDLARQRALAEYANWRNQYARIETSDPALNHAIEQSFRDIYVLRQKTPNGHEAIAAGLPWFADPFGRDDELTGLETMPYIPDESAKVARTMAAYQGAKDNPATGEKPGKIMHELRVGEMARNGEIPFAPSYHTVDATPLFLSLIGRYVQTTGDLSLVKELQPNIDAALKYLDEEVKRGNGYLIYGGQGKEPLSNQGWKDSGDSIVKSSGELAEAPIALSEVQGYLFDAWKQMSNVFRLTGDTARAEEFEAKAAALQQRFQHDFWMPEHNFVALALDGHGKQADVVSSNPGHLLMTGILNHDQAMAVAQGLMKPNMYNGWGIKTLASDTARHFDNSYHDGSVWPHDNSIIAMGLHTYAPEDTARLFWSLFEVAKARPNYRLPELFGGYDRANYAVPVPYPVACEPQAWSAAALMSMVNSTLGGHIDGLNNSVTFDRPTLPEQLRYITLRGYKVGDNSIDVEFVRGADGKVHVNVLNNPNNVTVAVKQ